MRRPALQSPPHIPNCLCCQGQCQEARGDLRMCLLTSCFQHSLPDYTGDGCGGEEHCGALWLCCPQVAARGHPLFCTHNSGSLGYLAGLGGHGCCRAHRFSPWLPWLCAGRGGGQELQEDPGLQEETPVQPQPREEPAEQAGGLQEHCRTGREGCGGGQRNSRCHTSCRSWFLYP